VPATRILEIFGLSKIQKILPFYMIYGIESGSYAVLALESKKNLLSEKGKNCRSKGNSKRTVIAGTGDSQKSGLVCTITEMFPSLYPPLPIAMVHYYLFRGPSQAGRHSGGGKPKVKPPGMLRVGVNRIVYLIRNSVHLFY
jgi:hypothetical protein